MAALRGEILNNRVPDAVQRIFSDAPHSRDPHRSQASPT
jgi:hypothetical protein